MTVAHMYRLRSIARNKHGDAAAFALFRLLAVVGSIRPGDWTRGPNGQGVQPSSDTGLLVPTQKGSLEVVSGAAAGSRMRAGLKCKLYPW